MPYCVGEIAQLIRGRVVGDPSLSMADVNSLSLAGPQEISFVSSPRHFQEAEQSKAGCVIAPETFSSSSKTVIMVSRPKASFVKAMWLFHTERYVATGIHHSAIVDPSAKIGTDVSVGPGAVIGKEARIGDRVRIGPCTAIGEAVRVGEDACIYPNVTLYHGVAIGSRVVIHAGCVIGADGFGFVLEDSHHLKVPQLGSVIIEDDVEMGANCTIDRATFGFTVIGRGTKLDNQVHVAHNVTVGEHSLLVAQVGIAGSSKIGKYVTLAGQAGVADNATIGDFTTVGAQAGVISGQKIDAHQTVWGLPARPIDETKRQLASLGLLPKLLERIRSLEARLQVVEQSGQKAAARKPARKRPAASHG
ncbi:MAG: UDP-3-O-(3-hydroxymyristoyl)glucosamine N-acyltransferase [Candidatus Omnitrophica bacterium]|nr:UDP-3-O-(3-hydroxymyristoyl)glucosamine N-acyltransferase [Candidatus Omnitrophota bacterium]